MSKVVVLGFGHMGKAHTRVLHQLGHEVVTVDPDPAAGADWLEAMPLADFDVACVAVPIPQLASVARAALEDGVSVLVEKPGATTTAELTGLHGLAKALGRRLFVGYTERWNPAAQALAEYLDLVGTIRHVSAWRLGSARERGGDPALDLAVHDLDVLDLFGFDLEAIASLGTPTHLSALLRAGEASVTIEASHIHPIKVRRLDVIGDDGSLSLDYQDRALTLVNADGGQSAIAVRKAEPLVAEWEAFISGAASTGLAALTAAEGMRQRYMGLPVVLDPSVPPDGIRIGP